MPNILKTVEEFTERNRDKQHSHITSGEAIDFYLATTEGFIDPQPLLGKAEALILGCTACADVFVQSQPNSVRQNIAKTIVGAGIDAS
ncbi:MAG: hypothetical protein ABSB12_02005 [Candidatus Saccharimonadales bacterium]|jgi:hypothetical protein